MASAIAFDRATRLYIRVIFIPSDIDPIDHMKYKFELLTESVEKCFGKKRRVKHKIIKNEQVPGKKICRISLHAKEEDEEEDMNIINIICESHNLIVFNRRYSKK